MTAETLDLGCGDDKLPGAIGMDRVRGPKIDIVHDLDRTPWPIEDGRFGHVRAQNVLEHVTDLIAVMDEVWRVCRPGATVDIFMPFMNSVTFATDPTHKRAAAYRTFHYFDPRTSFGQYRYTDKARFDVVKFEYHRGHPGGIVGTLNRWLDPVLLPLAQRYPDQYECYFTGLYPVHNIRFTLRAVK
ncbi:MAG: methyltransferase domain-containing protein [Myxococcales bacterium]|nr:methyltransferase domain-containing protein [Myxococcales bacterium]